jgi:3-phenylpropionate/trans-cinnamate dioxygenase ferredoxin component
VGWEQIAQLSDMEPGTVRQADLNGLPVCLVRTQDGQLFALDDECSHEQALLSEGCIEGSELECPLHYSRFDVHTGKALALPATEAVRTFGVRVTAGGGIEVLAP